MTLRRKTVTIICLTLIGLLMLIYIYSQIILMGSFDRLEEQNTEKNIERAKDALSSDIERLESIVGDWAPWDEAYEFIIDGNEDFIRTNLNPSTLPNLKLNLILFYNISGNLVYGQNIDINTGKIYPIPQLFQKSLSPDNILINHTNVESSVKGIIMLDEGPMIVASKPIIMSNHEGPVRGAIIMGRFIDSDEIERLSKITHLSLNISRFDNPVNSEFQSAIKLLSKEKPFLIQQINNDIIAGYVLLNDIEENPAIMIRADLPRAIHMQGENTIRFLMIFIIGSGLFFGLVNLLLLERNVLYRLAFLSSNVSAIGATGDHSMRISISGKDELSKLADEINGMLEQLEIADKSKSKELLLKEIYHRVKNNLQIVISLLNLQSQKTKDKNVIDIFKDSQNRIKSMALIHEKLYKSKDFTGINMNEYIHDLTINLFHTYGINPDNIKLIIDIDNISLGLDIANPIGLIVTELVSNALKHAFPPGNKGELFISLHSDGKGTFILLVRDNGIGFPKDIDFMKTETLGMQLVTNLVGQINGIIELETSTGTEFKISFSEKKTGVPGNE